MPRRVMILVPVLVLLCSCGGPMGDEAQEELVGVSRHSIPIASPGENPGGTLSYLAARVEPGVERRLIMVHGTPGSAGAFRGFLNRPPPALEVLSVDRPGFGESSPNGAVVSFRDQAAALADLLIDHAGRKPMLLGHSLGGPIVARAAADFPHRVGAIVILAGSLDPQFEKVGFMQAVASTGVVRAVLPRMLRNSLVELRAGRAQTEQLADVLPLVRCPVLIIHGTKDGLVPYANVAYMERAFTGAASLEVVTIPGGDHFLPWNRSQEVRDAIERLARRGREEGW